jgi:LysM repeat protein
MLLMGFLYVPEAVRAEPIGEVCAIPAHAKKTRRPNRIAATAVIVAAVALAALSGLADTGRHTVRRGETLGQIARRYGTTAAAIAQANGIRNINVIIAGTTLVIPAAATPGAPAPAAAPAPTGVVYVVRRGDSLYEIARRYGTTVAALAQANGIANPRRISIGQRITIVGGRAAPAGPAAAPPAAAPTGAVHVVRPGETLGKIARRYGTTAAAIAQANGIRNINVIRVGQRLVIPGAPAPAPAGGGGGIYVVRPGDTLAAVAARHGLTAQALAAANGLAPTDRLYVGNRLFLASPNRPAAPLGRCPVPGARFSNDFSFPRAGGRFHNGVDLFAPRGTPVAAPVGGRIFYTSGPIGGHQFLLSGDDGNRYAGSHLERFGAGGRVAAGTIIGYVGNSGNAAGANPHLHFEIHPGGGAAVNPYPALAAAC